MRSFLLKALFYVSIFSIGIFIAYLLDDKDSKTESSSSEDKLDEYDVVDLATFKIYAKNVADNVCERNNNIKNLQNSDNREREEENLINREAGYRMYFSSLARQRDFPDNYLSEAYKVYDDALKSCGYLEEVRY